MEKTIKSHSIYIHFSTKIAFRDQLLFENTIGIVIVIDIVFVFVIVFDFVFVVVFVFVIVIVITDLRSGIPPRSLGEESTSQQGNNLTRRTRTSRL